MFSHRIKKELSDMEKYKEKNNIKEWNAYPIDGYYLWEAYVYGPEDSPYEGGKFKLRIDFPSNYPENPFKIRFLTKIYHPFVSEKGEIHCCDFPNFYVETSPGDWKRDFTLRMAIEEIRDKLKNFKINCGYCNPEATKMFQKNREKFNEIAKDWTEKYAKSKNITFEEYNTEKEYLKQKKQKELEEKEKEKEKNEINNIKNEFKEFYKNQISYLKEMGFYDEALVIDILNQCNGDVNLALNILTGFN